MKRIRKPNETKRKVIDSARKILREGGIFTKFTLEKVAQKAGVSKGGLLHHYPDKESLLRAVAEDVIAQFEEQLADELNEESELNEREQHIETDAPERPLPGHFTQAYIRAGLVNNLQTTRDISPVLLAFLQASQNEHETVSRFDQWQQKTEQDGLDIVMATIIRLAVDGLLYTEVIDGKPIDQALRGQVVERLIELANE